MDTSTSHRKKTPKRQDILAQARAKTAASKRQWHAPSSNDGATIQFVVTQEEERSITAAATDNDNALISTPDAITTIGIQDAVTARNEDDDDDDNEHNDDVVAALLGLFEQDYPAIEVATVEAPAKKKRRTRGIAELHKKTIQTQKTRNVRLDPSRILGWLRNSMLPTVPSVSSHSVMRSAKHLWFSPFTKKRLSPSTHSSTTTSRRSRSRDQSDSSNKINAISGRSISIQFRNHDTFLRE